MTECLKKFLRAFRNLRDRFSLPMPAIVRRHPIVAVLLACMLGYLPLYITIRGDDAHLAVRWEGAVIDWNFRDVGQSVNTCLGEDLLQPGLLYRAAGWFSGWSCSRLEYPDRIITLSYDPHKKEKCSCWDDRTDKPNVGIVPDRSTKLDSLEFISTWRREDTGPAACAAVSAIIDSVLAKKKTLIHCDAGRDRTGTMAALFSALALEEAGRLDDTAIDALECDYRKTQSLKPEKYGRMRDFLQAIGKRRWSGGTVAGFLHEQCALDPDRIHRAGRGLLAPPRSE